MTGAGFFISLTLGFCGGDDPEDRFRDRDVVFDVLGGRRAA